MKTRIAPILCKEVPAISWHTNKKKSSLENLNVLLDGIQEMRESLESRSLPSSDHLALREKLKTTLSEAGIGLTCSKLLKKSLSSKWAKEKATALAQKNEVNLLRELLRLAQNEPKLRAKSHVYEEAWAEVEADYFAKMSIYRAELALRN